MNSNAIPRLLKADEISCRAQQIIDYKNGGYGAVILLYKDARTDMTLLDETYGVMNWQREHFAIDGNMFCGISVWDESKRSWVMKQDVGVESKTEATKGEASDSFKRSGTNWGIGRELYTAPDILINLEKEEFKTGDNGKVQTSFKFGMIVHKIEYNESREISHLVLVDKKNNIRFTFGISTKLTRKDAIDIFCADNKISMETIAGMKKSLQQAGQLSALATADMSDAEFDKMLELIKAEISKPKTK